MNTSVETTWMSVAIAGLKAATVEERAEFLGLLGPVVAIPAEKPKAARAKVVKMSVPLPEGIPTADDYRLTEIDASVCVARKLAEKDMRFRPFVYREAQCGAALVEGSDLCSRCSKNETKYAAEPKPGAWTGRVGEDPLDWVHMLGTTWAEDKKPKFSSAPAQASAPEPATASAPASAPVAEVAEVPEAPLSSSSSAPVAPAPAPAPVAPPAGSKAAAKAAEKAAKDAEKAAAKEAEKAAKEVAKAAEKAAKEVAKAAEKAAKDAEKAAAKAAKAPAKAPAKAAAAPAAPAKAEAKAPAAAEPVDVTGELKLIDGTLYMVKNDNVYEYDELTEKAGDFVGRLTAEETIDTDGEEVVAAESESE